MTEEARNEIRQWLRDQLILEHKRLPLFREAMNNPRIYCGIIGLRTVNDEEKAEDIVFPVHLDEVEILAECYEKAVAHRINELKARLDEI